MTGTSAASRASRPAPRPQGSPRRERWRPFFAVGTEAGRYASLRWLARWAPFLLLGLRARSRARSPLSHRTREMLYAHIRDQPGAYYRSIQRDLGLKQGTLSHHLYALERAALIKRRREGLRVRFFPGGQGALRTHPMNEWQWQVLRTVRARPGVSQVEVARALGVTKQALRYHVEALRQAGLLRVARAGRETELTVPADVWQRVGRCGQCRSTFHAEPGATQWRCGVCHAWLTPPPPRIPGAPEAGAAAAK